MSSYYDRLTRAVARAVAIVSPETAERYLRSHKRLRAYEAGKSTGTDRRWNPTSRTGDREIGGDWAKTTGRARDLVRNNPLASNAMRNKVALAVGDALWPQSRVMRGDALDRQTCAKIEARFARWAEDCTANGRDWDSLKRLVFRHIESDGEVVLLEVATEVHPYQLELLEPDQIDSSVDGIDTASGGRCVRGIEYNNYGRPVAFYLLTAHPGDSVVWSSKSIRVPASRVLHLFDPERISEGRGICRYASSIMPSYAHDQHRGSVMDLLRLAAAYGVFIKTDSPEDHVAAAETEADESGQSVTDADGNVVKYINPAAMHFLGKHQSIECAKPEQPTATFKDFEQSHLRMAAAGFGLSYETFTGDMTNVNFSSLRGGQVPERSQMRMMTRMLIRRLCTPVWRRWMDVEVATALLSLPGYWGKREGYQAVNWSMPALPATDPTKEEAADSEAIKNCTTNRHAICERKGVDFDDNLALLRAEAEGIKAAGLSVESVADAVVTTVKNEEGPNA